MDDRAKHQTSGQRPRFSGDLLQEAKRARGRLLRDMVLALFKSIAPCAAKPTVQDTRTLTRRGGLKATPGP
jgi:hypothetical protein